MRSRALLALLFGSALAGCAPAKVDRARSPRGATSEHVVIDAGALRLDVSLSRTAQLFHVVDQLSAWSPYTHRQYDRWADAWTLDSTDRALLEAHAAMRRPRGWGNGFEQALYVDGSVDEALEHAVATDLLTREEAKLESAVLARFERRVTSNIEPGWDRVRSFAMEMKAQAPHLRAVAGALARFVSLDRPALEVPAFFIVDPDDTMTGGGMNGGRLVVEVPKVRDVSDVLLHEALHAFLETRKADLLRATEGGDDGVAGPSFETLNEGIAYALAPGLVHPADDDPLARDVDHDRAAKKTLADPYARFHRYALELRPLLAHALSSGGTLETFLPQAQNAWRKIVSPHSAVGVRRGRHARQARRGMNVHSGGNAPHSGAE